MTPESCICSKHLFYCGNTTIHEIEIQSFICSLVATQPHKDQTEMENNFEGFPECKKVSLAN